MSRPLHRARSRDPGSPSGPLAQLQIHAGPLLTVRTARALCDAVRRELGRGLRILTLDLSNVERVDAAGLAAVLQSIDYAEAHGARLVVTVHESLRRQLIEAHVVEELLLAAAAPGVPTVPIAAEDPSSAFRLVEPAAHVALREPEATDMPRFKAWAEDPFLDQMVGSELLYRCRHRDVEDSEFVSAILDDPRAVTFVVEALEGPLIPLGFVRLYGVDLPEQYGFVETVLTEGRLLRKGWGIQATRLFAAWAQDTLRVRRLEAKVYSYNVLSINALKRNGFQQEGVLRGARLYGGQRWDILVFGLVEEEMNAQRAQSSFPYLGLWP